MKLIQVILFFSTLIIAEVSAGDEMPIDETKASMEWQSYVDSLSPIAGSVLELMPDIQDAQLRQEMYRMLFSGVSAAYLGLFLGDPEYPEFSPFINHGYNFFGPNPDTAYSMAAIEDSGIYRISGNRGTGRLVVGQVGSGTFLPGGMEPLGPNLASFDLDELTLGADGSFEVVLSSLRPEGYKGDWWKLDEGATYLQIREVFYDWNKEKSGRFAIERLDRPAIKPRLQANEIENRLRKIASWAENWTKNTLPRTNGFAEKGYVNKVFVQGLSDVGGVDSQKYVFGNFQLGPEEALVYETEVPNECGYWNIQLTDLSWSAIDPVNRQSSINGHTAVLDGDGKFRAVISAVDPGVPNWLDTAGYADGSLIGRWMECSEFPTPNLKKVKIADIRQYLPAETPEISSDQRDRAIRLRREGAQLRRLW
jgi:hypothetical protein